MSIIRHNIHSYQLDITGTGWTQFNVETTADKADIFNRGADVLMSVGWEIPNVNRAFYLPNFSSYEFGEGSNLEHVYFKLVGSEPTRLYIMGA